MTDEEYKEMMRHRESMGDDYETLIEYVLDILMEVGNGTTDENLSEALVMMFRVRDLLEQEKSKKPDKERKVNEVLPLGCYTLAENHGRLLAEYLHRVLVMKELDEHGVMDIKKSFPENTELEMRAHIKVMLIGIWGNLLLNEVQTDFDGRVYGKSAEGGYQSKWMTKQ